MYLPLHVGAEGKTDQNGNPLDLGYQKDNNRRKTISNPVFENYVVQAVKVFWKLKSYLCVKI